MGVCFQNRYNAATRFVRDGLQSGAWGRLLGARAFVTWQRDRAYYTESGWRGRLATEGGGVLLNRGGAHAGFAGLACGGLSIRRSRVCHPSPEGRADVEDTAEIHLTFEGDRHALLYATTAYCEKTARC